MDLIYLCACFGKLYSWLCTLFCSSTLSTSTHFVPTLAAALSFFFVFFNEDGFESVGEDFNYFYLDILWTVVTNVFGQKRFPIQMSNFSSRLKWVYQVWATSVTIERYNLSQTFFKYVQNFKRRKGIVRPTQTPSWTLFTN